MANEAQVRLQLLINKKDPSTQVQIINYTSPSMAFTPTVSGTMGPTPGTVSVSVNGTNISLSALTNPGGLCLLINQDPTNYVTYGVYDVDRLEFMPFGELLPGEGYILRLARDMLTKEYSGVGTGTSATNTFRMYAHTAACVVFVAAFDA